MTIINHLSLRFSLLKCLCPEKTIIMSPLSKIIELKMITLILGFENILLPILKRIKDFFKINLFSSQLSDSKTLNIFQQLKQSLSTNI